MGFFDQIGWQGLFGPSETFPSPPNAEPGELPPSDQHENFPEPPLHLSPEGGRVRAAKRLGQEFSGRLRGCRIHGDQVKEAHQDVTGGLARTRVKEENAYLGGCKQIDTSTITLNNPLKESDPRPYEVYSCCPCEAEIGPACRCDHCVTSQMQPHNFIHWKGIDDMWLDCCVEQLHPRVLLENPGATIEQARRYDFALGVYPSDNWRVSGRAFKPELDIIGGPDTCCCKYHGGNSKAAYEAAKDDLVIITGEMNATDADLLTGSPDAKVYVHGFGVADSFDDVDWSLAKWVPRPGYVQMPACRNGKNKTIIDQWNHTGYICGGCYLFASRNDVIEENGPHSSMTRVASPYLVDLLGENVWTGRASCNSYWYEIDPGRDYADCEICETKWLPWGDFGSMVNGVYGSLHRRFNKNRSTWNFDYIDTCGTHTSRAHNEAPLEVWSGASEILNEYFSTDVNLAIWPGDDKMAGWCDRCPPSGSTSHDYGTQGERRYAMPKQISVELNFEDQTCEPDDNHKYCETNERGGIGFDKTKSVRNGPPPQNFSVASGTYILDRVSDQTPAGGSELTIGAGCTYPLVLPNKCNTLGDDYCIKIEERELSLHTVEVVYQKNPYPEYSGLDDEANPEFNTPNSSADYVGNFWRGEKIATEDESKFGDPAWTSFSPAISVRLGFRNSFDCQFCGIVHAGLSHFSNTLHDINTPFCTLDDQSNNFDSLLAFKGEDCPPYLPVRGWQTGLDGGLAGTCRSGKVVVTDGTARREYFYEPYTTCFSGAIDLKMISHYCSDEPKEGHYDLKRKCSRQQWDEVHGFMGPCEEYRYGECIDDDYVITATTIGTASITEIPDEGGIQE